MHEPFCVNFSRKAVKAFLNKPSNLDGEDLSLFGLLTRCGLLRKSAGKANCEHLACDSMM
jgi:hypothetical protein